MLLASQVLDRANYTIHLTGLKILLHVLLQSYLLSPSGQLLFLVVVVVVLLWARLSPYASMLVSRLRTSLYRLNAEVGIKPFTVATMFFIWSFTKFQIYYNRRRNDA